MAHIEIIPYEKANGELKKIYDEVIEKRGKLSEVLMVHSLNPKSLLDHLNLYLTIMFEDSPLTRAQREMLAVVVSAANECDYCRVHHKEALMHYWQDEEKVSCLITRDFTEASLSETDKLLCNYAYRLTSYPSSKANTQMVQEMKKAGISDRAILDATMVISYFNFVNRMVFGLNVNLEKESGGGFKY